MACLIFRNVEHSTNTRCSKLLTQNAKYFTCESFINLIYMFHRRN